MDNQNGNIGNGNAEGQTPVANGSGPQPVIDGTPAEVALNPEAASAQRRAHARPAPQRLPQQRLNGEDGQRRNRRSRRGGRGRPDFERPGERRSEPTQSADAGGIPGAAESRGRARSDCRDPGAGSRAPSEPEITAPNPLPVEPD